MGLVRSAYTVLRGFLYKTIGKKATGRLRELSPHTLFLSIWARIAFKRYYARARRIRSEPREIDASLAELGFLELPGAVPIDDAFVQAIEDALAANESNSNCGGDLKPGTNTSAQFTYLSKEGFKRLNLAGLIGSSRIIDRLERHLGCYVRSPYIDVYRTYPATHRQWGSFLWHIDQQPRDTYKVMIYLDRVGEGNGPFSYIPGSHKEYHGFPQFGGGSRRKDQSPAVYREFHGERGDAIIFNVNGFHKGGVCEERSRLVLVLSLIPSTIPWREHLQRFGFAVVPDIENYVYPERVWWTR